jgi:hypothetical protein
MRKRAISLLIAVAFALLMGPWGAAFAQEQAQTGDPTTGQPPQGWPPAGGAPADFPNGFPGGFPEDLPDGFPPDFPADFPADFPGGMPPFGDAQAQGQFGGPRGGMPGGRGGGPGGGFGPNQQEYELVDEFDEDGDGVLDATERAAALASIGRTVRTNVAGTPGPSLTADDVTTYPETDALYDPTAIRTIFVELDEENWEAELEAFYNTDVHLIGTVQVDGVTYADVGVRFRGNSSFSMVAAGLKRPLRLKLDLVVDDQDLLGYRTLNLINGANDPSSLRTVVYSMIAQDYIAVPKVGLVRLVVNGESWGIYQDQQQYNKDFLADYFDDTGGVRWKVSGSPNGQGGMLYLGDDPDTYRSIYEIDNKDKPESWAALIDLFRTLNETPTEDLVTALDPILDIDGVLRFFALEVALSNSDGFYTRASDYYIYLDESGKFHVMPHDFNEALGAGDRGPGNRGGGSATTLDPLVNANDASKPLRTRLLEVPELRERYLAYVRDIAETWLDWDTLGPIVTELHESIDADFATDTRALFTYEQFQASVEGLKDYVEARRAYLLSALPE